jgi:TrmH family RNA methyltransferase
MELAGTGQASTLAQELANAGTRVHEVSPRTFARLTSRDGPDGVAAIAGFGLADLWQLDAATPCRVLVLDRFESPGNVGTLVRSANAAGAAAVLLSERRVRPNHPLVVKSSVGAVFSTPIAAAPEVDAQRWLRDLGFQVVAADPAADASYREIAYADRVAIVLGSERFGLSKGWRGVADATAAIPMLGSVDSLNAGHAGALLLFEALHQHRVRRGQRDPS